MKTSKGIIGIVLLFVMLFGIIRNNLLYSIYEYDTSLFVSMFCENKESPELNCEGKCFLSKMQKQDEQENRKAPERSWEYPLFDSVSTYLFAGTFVSDELNMPSDRYSNIYTYSFSSSVFNPPRFIC